MEDTIFISTKSGKFTTRSSKSILVVSGKYVQVHKNVENYTHVEHGMVIAVNCSTAVKKINN